MIIIIVVVIIISSSGSSISSFAYYYQTNAISDSHRQMMILSNFNYRPSFHTRNCCKVALEVVWIKVTLDNFRHDSWCLTWELWSCLFSVTCYLQSEFDPLKILSTMTTETKKSRLRIVVAKSVLDRRGWWSAILIRTLGAKIQFALNYWFISQLLITTITINWFNLNKYQLIY